MGALDGGLAGGVGLDDAEIGGVGMLGDVGEESACPAPDAVGPALGDEELGGSRRGALLEAFDQDGHEGVQLAGEVRVEGGAGHTRGGDDVGDAGPYIALAGDDLRGRLEDAATTVLGRDAGRGGAAAARKQRAHRRDAVHRGRTRPTDFPCAGEGQAGEARTWRPSSAQTGSSRACASGETA